MKRTKILLAFGMHGGGRTEKTPPDRKFFRQAVAPFLEQEVAAGRRVVVIQEQNLAYDLVEGDGELTGVFRPMLLLKRLAELTGRPPPPDSIYDTLVQGLDKRERELNEKYARTLDQGKGLDGFNALGYEEVAVELNRRSPGSVSFVCELQTRDTFWATINAWFAETMPRSDDLTEILIDIIRTTTDRAYVRDGALIEQVFRFHYSDDERTIVLPRGALHVEMRRFFDPGIFDVHVEPEDIEALKTRLADGNPLVPPHFERYRGILSPERLKHHAHLAIATSDDQAR